jgi:hypothetical protein
LISEDLNWNEVLAKHSGDENAALIDIESQVTKKIGMAEGDMFNLAPSRSDESLKESAESLGLLGKDYNEKLYNKFFFYIGSRHDQYMPTFPAISHAADILDAATKGLVGWGHGNEYYRGRINHYTGINQGRTTEAFANWVDLLSSGQPIASTLTRVLSDLLPRTTKELNSLLLKMKDDKL